MATITINKPTKLHEHNLHRHNLFNLYNENGSQQICLPQSFLVHKTHTRTHAVLPPIHNSDS